MMAKRWRTAPVWILLCVLWTAMIFGFSLQNGTASSNESHAVTGILCWLGGRLGAENALSVGVVRKLAHFFEYFVLGGLSYVTFRSVDARRCAMLGFGYSLAVALCDEFVCQGVSEGRAPLFGDVVIDATGAILGVFAVFLILLFLSKGRKRKKDDKI